MRIGLLGILILLLLALASGCTLRSTQKRNVYILALENLGVDRLTCTEPATSSKKSGFAVLCKNSVRFTHAYTTSLHARAAVASILTGLAPFDHQVRDNNSTFLPANFRTLAELAHDRGFATSFFSGGPSVIRNSGLQQGFELFDDNLAITSKKLLRSFKETSSSFWNWSSSQSRPIFAFFYIPDLFFIHRPTVNELGEARNLSYESQFEEFDNALFGFIDQLITTKQFNESWFILVGLSSQSIYHDTGLLDGPDLRSTQSQVALLIKPPRQARDEGLSWTYDKNVSIADIGATFFDLFAEKNSTGDLGRNGFVQSLSLRPILENSEPEGIDSRWIVSESSWPESLGLGSILYSIKNNQFHFIHNGKVRFYNTLIDKLENYPLSSQENLTKEIVDQSKNLFQILLKGQNVYLDKNTDTVLGLSKTNYWIPATRAANILELPFTRGFKVGPLFIDHLVGQEFAIQGKWAELSDYFINTPDDDYAILARKNLGQRNFSYLSSCLKLLEKPIEKKPECQDRRLLALIDYIGAEQLSDETNKERSRKKIIGLWKNFVIAYAAHRFNMAMGIHWVQPLHEMNQWKDFFIALYSPPLQKLRAQLLRDYPL